MKKKLIACITTLLVAVAFMPVSAFAASNTVSMTGYDQVLKKGNTVFVAGAGDAIYKVKVKNGTVKSTKTLVKGTYAGGKYSYTSGMKLKGKYLYCQGSGEGTVFSLFRVNKSSGKMKNLASANDKGQINYVIKGKKIYYKSEDGARKVMKLNGASKKSTSTTPILKTKKSNASGYSVSYKEKGGKVITYLKTPKGTYKLGSTWM